MPNGLLHTDESDELNELWTNALAFIRDRLWRTAYNLWIEPLAPVCIDNGVFTVAAKDEIHRNTVEMFYTDYVLMGFHTYLHEVGFVRVVVQKEASK